MSLFDFLKKHDDKTEQSKSSEGQYAVGQQTFVLEQILTPSVGLGVGEDLEDLDPTEADGLSEDFELESDGADGEDLPAADSPSESILDISDEPIPEEDLEDLEFITGDEVGAEGAEGDLAEDSGAEATAESWDGQQEEIELPFFSGSDESANEESGEEQAEETSIRESTLQPPRVPRQKRSPLLPIL